MLIFLGRYKNSATLLLSLSLLPSLFRLMVVEKEWAPWFHWQQPRDPSKTPRYPHSGCGVSEWIQMGSASPGAFVCSKKEGSTGSFSFPSSPGIPFSSCDPISKASRSLLVGHHIRTLGEEHLRMPREWGRAGPGNAKTWLRRHIGVTGVSGRMRMQSWSRGLASSLSVGLTNRHGG